VQSMVDTGILTLGEAAAHPDASVLDRAIGHQSSVQADVSDWIDLRPGDTVLLCSDGLCGYVSDAEIEAVLRADDDPQSATDSLVECALKAGGHDNVTVQLARYEPENGGLVKRVAARPVMMIPVLVALAGVGAYVVGGRLAQPSVAEAGRLSARLAEANERIDQLQRAAPKAVTAAVASSVAAAAASSSSPSAKPRPAAPATKPKPVSKPDAAKEAEKKSAIDPDATQAAGRNPGDEPRSGANAVPRESASEVPAPAAPIDKPPPGGDSVPLPDPVP
jgi:hypothetical protein